MTPFPNSPPIRKAAFFPPGITATHSARLHESSGIPLSGAARNSRTTVAASPRRFTSPDEMSASTVEVHINSPAATVTMVFILLPPKVRVPCKIGAVQTGRILRSVRQRPTPLNPMVHFVHDSASVEADALANGICLGVDTDGLVMSIPLDG